jgi:hypothetical protein
MTAPLRDHFAVHPLEDLSLTFLACFDRMVAALVRAEPQRLVPAETFAEAKGEVLSGPVSSLSPCAVAGCRTTVRKELTA